MIESLRTWALLRSLRSGGHRSPRSLEVLQAELLRGTLAYAYQSIPFYRRVWDEEGFHPTQVREVGDLARVPILAGPVMRDAVARGELLGRDVDPRETTSYDSSGSSGRPLKVLRRTLEQRLWRAVGLRVWFEHGFRWRDRTVQFDSEASPPHFLQRFGISHTTWISNDRLITERLTDLVEAKAQIIVGTPTALRRISEAMHTAGATIPRPRIVICPGEVLDAETRRIVEQAFGVAPVGLYGMTEVGYVAWQCERREGFHENAETCLVEVLREGRGVDPGELGAIVVTDLRSRTMPLIRYDTGDLGLAANGPCPCGRQGPLVGAIEGRAREALRLPDGRILTRRWIVDQLNGFPRLGEYRLHQETPSRFRLALGQRGTNDSGGAESQRSAREDEAKVLSRLRDVLGRVEIIVEPGRFRVSGNSVKTNPISSDLAPPFAAGREPVRA